MARRQQEGLHEVHEHGDDGILSYKTEYDGQELLTTSEDTTNGKKPKKTQEEKRADFARLASRRVSTAIDAIDSLIHLCAPQSYAWTAEDRMEIITTLHDRVSRVHDAFVSVEESGGKKTAKPLSFRLPV